MSNDLIDADRGISLSSGSYFGVIIVFEVEIYRGNLIPDFEGKNLSKLRLAEASYWRVSSLDLSEILCWIDPKPTEVYLADEETIPKSESFKFRLAFAAQPLVLSKSVSLSSLNHKHADLDDLSSDKGFFTPIIKFKIELRVGLPTILKTYLPLFDILEYGSVTSTFCRFLSDLRDNNSSK